MPTEYISIEQAAKYLAVSNLGGPFMPWTKREFIHKGKPSLDIAPHISDKVRPLTGKGCDIIYDREWQGIPEHEMALPAEQQCFLKGIKKEFVNRIQPAPRRYWREKFFTDYGLTICKHGKCAVPDCAEEATAKAHISINNYPKREHYVCPAHRDAARQDRTRQRLSSDHLSG